MADWQEYTNYAEKCLSIARTTGDREARLILREMAAEWTKLASVFDPPAAEYPADSYCDARAPAEPRPAALPQLRAGEAACTTRPRHSAAFPNLEATDASSGSHRSTRRSMANTRTLVSAVWVDFNKRPELALPPWCSAPSCSTARCRDRTHPRPGHGVHRLRDRRRGAAQSDGTAGAAAA